MRAEKNTNAGRGTLSLQDWINEVGVREVSRVTGVNESAVRHWRRGHCLPRTDEMRKIHKYSNGRVSYEEMIETFHRQHAKKVAAAAKNGRR